MRPNALEGFFNLNKPTGPTSHDMVDMVRRVLRQRRVGHGGTLDPLAQGVLPIGVGRATRLLSFFQDGDKVYHADVLLGVSTTTYDAQGEITARRPVPPLDRAGLKAALARFRGEIEQVPPPFSAIRQAGRRFYRRARDGQHVLPPARRVRIFRLELLSWEPPRLVLEVACGRGTYIRSLAHDLGEHLNCGGHVTGLVRLQVGPLSLKEALAPEDLEYAALHGRLSELLLPLDVPLRQLQSVSVTEGQVRALVQGQSVLPKDTGLDRARRVRAYDPEGRFVALLRYDPELQRWRPFRVFPPGE